MGSVVRSCSKLGDGGVGFRGYSENRRALSEIESAMEVLQGDRICLLTLKSRQSR